MNFKMFKISSVSCLLALMCIAFGQETPIGNVDIDKPFIADTVQLPEVIAFGLICPSTQTLLNKRISTCQEAQQATESALTESIKNLWYDPKYAPELISLGDWPHLYSITRVMRFKTNGCLFNIYDDSRNLFIAIKKSDGQDIWNMNGEHNNFVSQVIATYFNGENIGPLADKKMHYVCKEDKFDGFYYAYIPSVQKDYWSAYLWTDGKNIVLRLCKNYEEDKKTSAIEK